MFQDANVTNNRRRAVRLFQQLADDAPALRWKCFARVDSIDSSLLRSMAAAGCVYVYFGVESGDNEVLRKINKGFTIEQAYQAVCLTLKYIPGVGVSFIWGFPFETVQQCGETARWIARFRQAGCSVQSYVLSPLPNSAIFLSYKGPLDFNENIITSFNCSGGEDLTQRGTRIAKSAAHIFALVREFPHIFPGFYLYDYKNNIAPKVRMLQEEHHIGGGGD
jgi:radical SAM superfamily enzyme YgiQ (UPF0313 family)